VGIIIGFTVGLCVIYFMAVWWMNVSDRSKLAREINFWFKFLGIIAIVLFLVVMCASAPHGGCIQYARGPDIGDC
jgi:hypothetical protein